MDLFELGVKIDTTQITKAEKAIESLIAKMKGVDLNVGGTSSGGDSSAPIERKTKAVERYAKMTNTVAGALQYQKQAMDAINKSYDKGAFSVELYDTAVTNVKTKVESAINAINRKSEAFKQEQIAQKQAIAEANKYNAVMEKSQILASKTNLRVSFKEYAEKIALEKQAIAEANKAERAEASLERKRNSLASTTASLEGVTFRYNQRMKEINEIFPESIRDTDRYRAAVANADAEYQNSINRINAYSKVQEMAGTKTRLARHEMLNLSYQLQDIVVGFASGQRPMTVFIQQGAQIAGIASAAGLGLKGMATAMWDLAKGAGVAFLRFLSNPYVLAAVATITALTVAYKAFNSVLNNESGLSKAQSDFVRLGGTVDDFKSKLDELGGSTVTFSDKINALGLNKVGKSISSAFSDMGSAFTDFSKKATQGLIGIGAYLLSLRKSFTGLTEVKNPFDQALKDGQKAIEDTQNKFDKMKKDMETPLQIRMNIALEEQKIKKQLAAQTDIKSLQQSLLSPLEQIKATAASSLMTIEKAKSANAGYDPQTYADLQERVLAKEKADTDAYYADLAKKRAKDVEDAQKHAQDILNANENVNSVISKYSYGTAYNSVSSEIDKQKAKLNKDLGLHLISSEQYNKAIKYLKDFSEIEVPKAAKQAEETSKVAHNPLYTFNKSLQEQVANFDLLGNAYTDIAQAQQEINSLEANGITLSEKQRQSIYESISATNDKIRAHEQEMNIYAQGQGAIDQQIILQSALDDMLKNGKIEQEEYNQAMYDSSIATEQAKAHMLGYSKSFADTTQGVIELKKQLDDLNNAIKNKKVTSGYASVQKLNIQGLQNQQSFTNAGAGDIYGETRGKIDEVVKSQTEYNNALAAGLINQRQFEAGLRENANALFNLKASMGTATFTESLSNGMSNFLGDYKNIMGSMSKITTDFLAGFSSGFADAFAGAIVKGDNLKESLQNVSQTILTELVSALIQMGIKYALGTALGQTMTASQLLGIETVSTAQTAATTKAVAESHAAAGSVAADATTVGAASAGPAATTSTWSFGAAAAAGAAGMLALLAVAKMFTGGFKDGGYTGNYGTSDVAGVVHGQEFVVNADATAKNRALLEAMNNGATITGGSSTTATTQATNNMTYNHTSQITINGNPDNTTLALIAQAVEQGAKKGYALVAQDFKNNGNLRKAVVGNK